MSTVVRKSSFLLKRMFDFFDNRDKCCKPGFLRGNICSAYIIHFLPFYYKDDVLFNILYLTFTFQQAGQAGALGSLGISGKWFRATGGLPAPSQWGPTAFIMLGAVWVAAQPHEGKVWPKERPVWTSVAESRHILKLIGLWDDKGGTPHSSSVAPCPRPCEHVTAGTRRSLPYEIS